MVGEVVGHGGGAIADLPLRPGQDAELELSVHTDKGLQVVGVEVTAELVILCDLNGNNKHNDMTKDDPTKDVSGLDSDQVGDDKDTDNPPAMEMVIQEDEDESLQPVDEAPTHHGDPPEHPVTGTKEMGI